MYKKISLTVLLIISIFLAYVPAYAIDIHKIKPPSYCTGKLVEGRGLGAEDNVGDYTLDEFGPVVNYISKQYYDGPVLVKVITTIRYKDYDWKEILSGPSNDEIRIYPSAKETDHSITYIDRITGKPVTKKVYLGYSESLKRYVTAEEAIKRHLNVYYWDTGVRKITAIDGIKIENTKWSDYAGERPLTEQTIYHVRGPIPISIYTSDNEGYTLETGPTPPYNKNDRIFLPYRLIFEALGAEVDYFPKEGKTEKVTGSLNGKKIEMTIGSKTALIDGKPYEMDVAPEITKNRTYVPIRFAAEALGCRVEYVDISSTKSWPRPVVRIYTNQK